MLEARIRAQRYWYRDGLEEITLGVIFLLMGVEALARTKVGWFMPVTLIYVLLCLALVISVPRIKTAIRERITYRRSGYVERGGESWLQGRLARTLLFATVALVIAGAVMLNLRYGGGTSLDRARAVRWSPVGAGLTSGVVAVYVWVRYGLSRWLVVGVLAIILGVVVSIECPPRLAMGIWLAGNGCMWLCSGGVTLWNYVRTVPPAAAAT